MLFVVSDLSIMVKLFHKIKVLNQFLREHQNLPFSLELFVLIKFRYLGFVTVQLMKKTCSVNKRCLFFLCVLVY